MGEMLTRLGFDRQRGRDGPLLAEDFVFVPSNYPTSANLAVVHEEVFLDETPLTLTRQIHLQDSLHSHTTLTLRLTLCWNGPRDAMTLVARFPLSFQRAIPTAAAVNTTAAYGVGDFGIAWPWSGEGKPDALAFVRNNVFVSLDGHDATELVANLSRELDESLRRLPTVERYTEDPAGRLQDVRRTAGAVPRLPPGGRLDLGVLGGEPDTTLFFLTSAGSVNRAESSPAWYYRAGAEKGRQSIVLFRVRRGILPVRESLTVEIG